MFTIVMDKLIESSVFLFGCVVAFCALTYAIVRSKKNLTLNLTIMGFSLAVELKKPVHEEDKCDVE